MFADLKRRVKPGALGQRAAADVCPECAVVDGAAFVEDYYNTTSLHPTALVALLIASAAMMTVQRRYALIPMLALACCIAPAQRVVVLTLDFSLLRMMILMGWVRIVTHGDWVGFQLKPLDIAVLDPFRSDLCPRCLQRG